MSRRLLQNSVLGSFFLHAFSITLRGSTIRQKVRWSINVPLIFFSPLNLVLSCAFPPPTHKNVTWHCDPQVTHARKAVINWATADREREASKMAESLRRLVNIGTFSVLQDKLEKWLSDYYVSTGFTSLDNLFSSMHLVSKFLLQCQKSSGLFHLHRF